MHTIAIFLVVTSGLLHAVWNMFAKRSRDKTAFLWWMQVVATLVYLPWASITLWRHNIPAVGWWLLTLAVCAHALYVTLLARTYAVGDLSQVYPLMRGVSPLLVPIIGVTLLGEHLSAPGWFGVGCIVAGIWILGDWRTNGDGGGRNRLERRGAWLALAVGLSIAGYTSLDKVALDYVPAVSLNDASNLGNGLALSWAALRSHSVASEWRANWRTVLFGGVIAPGGYLLFLYALHLLPLAQLAPMREIGIVFGAILGIVVLKEMQGPRRIAAAGIITTGVLLLGIFG